MFNLEFPSHNLDCHVTYHSGFVQLIMFPMPAIRIPGWLAPARIKQYVLLRRVGAQDVARGTLSHPVGCRNFESTIWARTGSELAKAGRLVEADRALAKALSLHPGNHQARLARRHLPVERKADALVRNYLESRLTKQIDAEERFRYQHTIPLTSGLSKGVDELNRLEFSADPSWKTFSIIEKTFANIDLESPPPVPREIEIYRRIGSLVGEKHMRIPTYYGDCMDSFGRHVLFMEFVRRGSGTHPPFLRIQALEELTTLSVPHHEDLVRYVRTTQRARSLDFYGAVKRFRKFSDQDVQTRLERTVEALMERQTCIDAAIGCLRGVLAHGDAQTPNLIIDCQGRVVLVDLGGLRIEPAGYDLATCVRGHHRRRRLNNEQLGRFEARALEAFIRGMGTGKECMAETDVRLGYAAGIIQTVKISFRRVLNRQAGFEAHPKSVDDHPFAKFVKEELGCITDLLESALHNSRHL